MKITATVVEQPYDKITRINVPKELITFHGDGGQTMYTASISVDVVDAKGNLLLPANKPCKFHHSRELGGCSWLLNCI
jgi:hypothetical protein